MSNLTDTIKKLHSFRKLEVGWRFAGGGPPNDVVIRAAERFLQKAAAWGIEVSDVFAGPDREIMLGFYNGSHGIEITLEDDGRTSFAEDKENRQVDFVPNISEVELYRRIWTFQFPPVVTYVPSIRETSTRRTAGSIAMYLSLRGLTVESRSSTASAQSQLVEQYANICNDSTQPEPTHPVSTGSYQLIPCLTDA